MEAIRSVQIVENGEVHLQLPQQFWGQEVEIIVLSLPRQSSEPVTAKRSLRRCLKQYANPALIPQEEEVWSRSAVDKKLNKYISQTGLSLSAEGGE
ncbi:MAG: hypothetical protein GC158_07285 [Cyanobacteria bacterium RI_101]|nr:hypothetical protein [Cyanobacteria bacterium RI_101]